MNRLSLTRRERIKLLGASITGLMAGAARAITTRALEWWS